MRSSLWGDGLEKEEERCMDGDFGSERGWLKILKTRCRLEGKIQDTAEKGQEAGWQHSSEKEDT